MSTDGTDDQQVADWAREALHVLNEHEADGQVLSDVLCEVGVTDSAPGAGKGTRDDQAEVHF